MKDIKIVSGVGDPSSPYWGQLLSEEDEARLDPAGQPIVDGKRWGDCSTGIYLTISVGVDNGGLLVDRKTLGAGRFTFKGSSIHPELVMDVFTTDGLPTCQSAVAGAALELPEDLASDELKRKYVVEWIRETATEAMALYGFDIAKDKGRYKELGLQVAAVAEMAIAGTLL